MAVRISEEQKPLFAGVISVLVAILFAILDVVTGFGGFYLPIPWHIWLRSLVTAPALVYIFYRLFSNWGNWRLGASTVFLSGISILFGILTIGSGYNWLRITVLFIIYNLFVLPNCADDNEKTRQNWIFSGYLIVDYLILGSLDFFNTLIYNGSLRSINRYFLPVYVIYFTTFFQIKAKHWFFTLVITLIFSWSVFSIAGGKDLFVPGMRQQSPEDRLAFVNSWYLFWDSFGVAIKKPITEFNVFWNEATNTSYFEPANQQQTQFPQGVYIETIERGDIIFRETSPTYLLARIEARTLDQTIPLTIECYTEVETEVVTEETIEYVTEEVKGVVNEEATSEEQRYYLEMDVLPSVERTVPCVFAEEYENALPSGSYDVTFTATFDFSTDALQLIYLMDRDRYINDIELLIDKGQEPTKENILAQLYEIKDVDPLSVSSSGPVGIGVKTDKGPWDIGETTNLKYPFIITIQNTWTGSGMIKSINNVYLKIPQTFAFAPNSCSQTFTTTDEQAETGFKVSKLVQDPEAPLENITNYITLGCFMNVDTNSLDPVPVTRKFLKSHVDYTYVMEDSIQITVEGYDYGEAQDVVNRQGTQLVCCEVQRGGTVSYNRISEEKCLTTKDFSTTSSIVSSSYCPVAQDG